LPDFLNGGLPLDTVPVDTPEKKELLTKWFSPGGPAFFPDCAQKVDSAARQIKKVYPSVEKVTGLGLCWGSKVKMAINDSDGPALTNEQVLILASNMADTPFIATASAHPARLDPEDAKQLTVPTLILASDGEEPEVVKAFDEVKKPAGSEVHHYKVCSHSTEDAVGLTSNLLEGDAPWLDGGTISPS
jgi:hypothetical protein